MGALATGPVVIEAENGDRTTIGVHGGFLQVLNNQVTLITDRAEIADSHAEAKEVAARLADEEMGAEMDTETEA
jgi:F0F1-type ATP synthase epsilon subunit